MVLVNKVLNDRSVYWTRVSGRNCPKKLVMHGLVRVFPILYWIRLIR